MNPLSRDGLIAAHGTDVLDAAGERVGSIEDVYYDEETGRPQWIGIGTGLFGRSRCVVPVEGARLEDTCLRIPYDRERVKDAPGVDDDELSPEREAELYAFYGLTTSEVMGTDARSAAQAGAGGGEAAPQQGRTPQHDEPLYGDEARVGAGPADIGMRTPALDRQRARDRQTGDDIIREEQEALDAAGRPRLRRWAGGSGDARR